MSDLEAVTAAFPRLSMLVLGDAMLDSYLEGSTSRLAAEAPVPVVALARRVDRAGGAGNVAANARALGASVTLLSVVGADAEGERLCAALARTGVGIADLCRSSARFTLAKERVIADGQMLARVDHGTTEPVDEDVERALLERLGGAWEGAQTVVVSDYGYGVLTSRVVHGIACMQRTSPRTLLIDSKNLAAYRDVRPTVVKPNYRQAAALVGLGGATSAEDRARAVDACRDRLLEVTGASMAVVTLDADGAMVLDRSGRSYRAYGRPMRHARAAGAGDTFGATFALALSAGASERTAADLASAASAFVVGQDGTAVCTAADLRRTLDSASKLLGRRALAASVASHRLQGRRIVFTNGCFDLLHAGHIAFLNQAKTLGDVLIVAVNSDEGVRRLKGADRPIHSLNDRVGMLAALACVDHIVAFDDDDPRRLLRTIRPDTFVKGGGYQRDHLPEAPLVEALGGVVRLLPFVEHRSTTSLIQRIRNGTAEEALA